MGTLESYQLAKKQYQGIIKNKELYLTSIITDVFNPIEYKNICEIAAGNLELAKMLAKWYKTITTYEPLQWDQSNEQIPNLKKHKDFDPSINISDYHLILSICPYVFGDIYDDRNFEAESLYFATCILDKSIENKKDAFVVLSNTSEMNRFGEEIKETPKYKDFVQDDIVLYDKYEFSKHKVLIYKKEN